jgi:hypothetical protein
MKKIALTSLVLGVITASSSALAQNGPSNCPPGAWLCAEVTIGPQPAPPPVAPAPVVVQPAPPPPVIVQPPAAPPMMEPPPPAPIVVAPPPPVVVTPPRVIVVHPPRPRVIVTPAPPARVYIAPAPPPRTVVVYQQVQPPTYVGPRPIAPPRLQRHVGLQAQINGALVGSATGDLSLMGGLGAGLRFRGAGHLGAELGLNVVTGRDYNGDARTEVPATFSGLLYFNPRNRLQVYGLMGIGVSYATVRYAPGNTSDHGGLSGSNYAYFGGQAGLGLELQLNHRLSIFADVRGFLRGRIDGGTDTNPEFTRPNPNGDGSVQTTNVSAGALTQAGLVLYF